MLSIKRKARQDPELSPTQTPPLPLGEAAPVEVTESRIETAAESLPAPPKSIEAPVSTQPPTQASTLKMTAEDIAAAYKIFLKRHAESPLVIAPWVGVTGDQLLIDFLSSAEFLNRPGVKGLLKSIVKQILESEKTIQEG
jgi:hypothetical protein